MELPLFAHAIENAKDKHFFQSIIKSNFAFVVIIEFLLNFWTFDLWAEIIIIPVTIFFALLYAISEKEKEYRQVTNLLSKLQKIAGIYLLYNLIYNIFTQVDKLLKIDVLKELVLPFVLLITTIPMVYGLALYSQYENIFIRLKGSPKEKKMMQFSIIKFVGLNLSKATYILEHVYDTLVVSLNDVDLGNNLKLLSKKMAAQVGDNYMKRSNFYVLSSVIILFASLAGLILCNSEVSIKDCMAFNFSLDIKRIKDIMTYILATAVVISFFELIYALGYKMKKFEEFSQTKKIVFHELFYLINRQYLHLQEFIPLESPDELFINYIQYAYEIKLACDKSLAEYEYLFSRWEKATIRNLQTKTQSIILSIGILEDDISRYNIGSFSKYFNEKTISAPQDEKINTFTYSVKTDLEKYTDQIKLAYDEFKCFM